MPEEFFCMYTMDGQNQLHIHGVCDEPIEMTRTSSRSSQYVSSASSSPPSSEDEGAAEHDHNDQHDLQLLPSQRKIRMSMRGRV